MHLKRWENVGFVVGKVGQNATVLWFVPCQCASSAYIIALHAHTTL